MKLGWLTWLWKITFIKLYSNLDWTPCRNLRLHPLHHCTTRSNTIQDTTVYCTLLGASSHATFLWWLFFLGLKPRMKDHYRPQKMALWMNLIPDLQSAAIANRGPGKPPALKPNGHRVQSQSSEDMLDYRLYNELLPFVPKLKNLDANAFIRYEFE